MQKDNNNNKQIPKLRAKCSNWSIINILSQIAWPSSISNAKWGYVTERLWCTFSRGLKMVHCIVEVLHSHRLTNLSQRILRSRKCNENPDFHVLRQGSNKENSLWTGTRDWTSGYICIYNPLLGIHTPVTTFLSYNLISHRWWSSSNRPFPSSPGPLYQNEVRCSWEWKIISISKVEHLTSFWYRGQGNSKIAYSNKIQCIKIIEIVAQSFAIC